VDFTSRPSAKKPIMVASGALDAGVLKIDGLESISTEIAFEDWLRKPGPWIAGFDLPFGLPRELVEHLAWPTDWRACIAHYASLTREEIRTTLKAFCDARPAGAKFAHRACDGPAGSSPSMKWVNPPVAYMLHAGVPRLIAAGLSFPGLHSTRSTRVALEAYPGYLARAIIGRVSYKSDDSRKDTAERRAARACIVRALRTGEHVLGLRVAMPSALKQRCINGFQGDALDAVLCAVEAAWASTQPRYGMPKAVDALEGWIVGVPG
jgi:hypothetical protein